MSQLIKTIQTILENDLMVTDGWVTLYHANGEMGYTDGDPTPFVITDDDDEVYQEFDEIGPAISEFLIHAGISLQPTENEVE